MKVLPAAEILVPDDVDEGGRQIISAMTVNQSFWTWLTEDYNRNSILFRYYMGRQDFGESHEGGQQIVANFCNYIPKAIRGYMFGNPPKYSCKEDDPYGEEILDLFRRQNKWLIDSQLGLDMSIFGRAYELVFMPKGKDEPDSVVVPPMDAFVTYAGDMEKDSVFGCVRYGHKDDKGVWIFDLHMYTRTDYMHWQSRCRAGTPYPDGVDPDNKPEFVLIDGPTPHGFGRVPLIEYRNNKERQGDFEPVLDLQDAYNSLLSDRQDDKDAFAAAMLILQGQIIGEDEEETRAGTKSMKRTRVVQLAEDASISFLTKTLQEADVQVLQNQYASLIHKFAMVPDLSDESFAGNASGVAMAYKMFGTDQIVAEKVGQFKQGFRRRCKLYDFRMNNPTMAEGYQPLADIGGMRIDFAPNVPQDLPSMTQSVTQLTASGILSKQTARQNISIIEDPEKEAELVAEEQEEDRQRTQSYFEDTFGGMGGPQDQRADESPLSARKTPAEDGEDGGDRPAEQDSE
jgi:SPP1 family phage portal protein|nr:MAG TPA: PORTAL PROTEIN [Caudoviricetes sp.]